MPIAQVLVGYTLGGADLLRRAMGKKKPEEMAKQRQYLKKVRRVSVLLSSFPQDFRLSGKNLPLLDSTKSHSAAYALV